ncbi:MAG: hypothetical protein ACRDOK_10220 [Streptosporangiaceae bacterium]
MSGSMREILAREAAEAEARAEAEERGDIAPAPGQRGRKRAEDPAQVYAVRIPVSKLRRLRELAEEMQIAPSALIRQWVIERLDESDRRNEDSPAAGDATSTGSASPGELRLGPRRRRVPAAAVAEHHDRRERRRA